MNKTSEARYRTKWVLLVIGLIMIGFVDLRISLGVLFVLLAHKVESGEI